MTDDSCELPADAFYGPAVAWSVGALCALPLAVRFLVRLCGGAEIVLLRGAISEVLCLVALDAIFMALMQEGFFHPIKIGVLVAGVVLFGASLLQVWRLSAPRPSQSRDLDGSRPLVDDILPRCLFSDKFRQQMHDEVTNNYSSSSRNRSTSRWSGFGTATTSSRTYPSAVLSDDPGQLPEEQQSSPSSALPSQPTPQPDLPWVKAVDVHGNFQANFKRALVLGGAQLVLIAHYVGGSVVRGAPCFGEPGVYEFYWTGAVLKACYIAGTDVLAAPLCSLAFWWKVWMWARNTDAHGTLVLTDEALQVRTRSHSTPGFVSPYTWTYDVRPTDARLAVRCVMSLLVNQTGLIYIMSALPLQLAWSESREEFVLNAIAVFFIFQLDDLAVPVEYSLVSKKDAVSVPAEKDENNSNPTSTAASHNGPFSQALRF